ncbi:hypothetical protein [Spirosoma utsteinense]|uniref:Uncharacterized protein n=1 Tax=Spirosoma utsteinense TaxID=2585773 RepID=A0ABR6W765_9BACT|nr:hypothetical protein [Spirosoma utsteinense]MBC3788562.1 hypothetical protein [Spirosoma utsteinense]MBC3791831.1 hypothetical protein [Spirosoma utsteinense]
MKQVLFILCLLGGCIASTASRAQQPFSHCSAAFVSSKLIVDTYSPKGRCRLPASTTGLLTVQTVTMMLTKTKAGNQIGFKIAIRDKATGTLHLFSGKTYRQLPVQDVLATCKKGDRIVLLTEDRQYALPHNEIIVL